MAFSYSSRNCTPIINTLNIDQVFSKLLSHLTFIIHSHKVIIKKSWMFSACFNNLIFQPLKVITQWQLLEVFVVRTQEEAGGGGQHKLLKCKGSKMIFLCRWARKYHWGNGLRRASVCKGKGLEGKMMSIAGWYVFSLMELEKQVTELSDVDADFSHRKQLHQLKWGRARRWVQGNSQAHGTPFILICRYYWEYSSEFCV